MVVEVGHDPTISTFLFYFIKVVKFDFQLYNYQSNYKLNYNYYFLEENYDF